MSKISKGIANNDLQKVMRHPWIKRLLIKKSIFRRGRMKSEILASGQQLQLDKMSVRKQMHGDLDNR